MGRDNPLTKHTAPVEAGAAFRAARDGGLAVIEPLTPRANQPPAPSRRTAEPRKDAERGSEATGRVPSFVREP